MGRFDVISLDMFQTLVNVESRTNEVWRPILREGFSEAAAAHCAGELLEHFFRNWRASTEAGEFQLMKKVYQSSFEDHFRLRKLDYDSEAAVGLLFRGHRDSAFYEETAEFLQQITRAYRVYIVSDADDAMIPSFCREYPLTLYTSECFKSYKNDRQNAMFRQLLENSGVPPERVIHIGDSPSDVLGAARVGIAACWLNRNGRVWPHEDKKPDYEIRRLDEAYAILELA